MNIFLYSIKTIAAAIIEPMNLIILVILAIVFYKKNIKISLMQKMTIGESLDSPLSLTLSQIFMGIVAGAVCSFILDVLGIAFSKYYVIQLMFLTSLVLYLYKPRLMCFSYSGSLIGVICLINIFMNKKFNVGILLDINIYVLMAFVGVFHVIEGLLVIFDGSRGSIPVFITKDNKIAGGYSLNRYWALPVIIFILVANGSLSGSTHLVNTPDWWPLMDKSLMEALNTSILVSMPFYGMVGFNTTTFTKNKRKKTLISGLCILIYGISVVAFSKLCVGSSFGKFAILIYTPLAHEIMIQLRMYYERKGEKLFVSDKDGIMVLELAPNSIANKIGIEIGDKIVSINDKDVENETEVYTAVKENIYGLSLKVRKKSGNIKEYKINRNIKFLGTVLVPRVRENINDDSVIEFKQVFDKIKNRDE